jgi:hypothetical protein
MPYMRDIEIPHCIEYSHPVSFAEILEEIPNLSFAQRQELVRRAIAIDKGRFLYTSFARPPSI